MPHEPMKPQVTPSKGCLYLGLAEAIRDAAETYGLPADVVAVLAAQTLLGSALPTSLGRRLHDAPAAA